jgi:hypothetical protein
VDGGGSAGTPCQGAGANCAGGQRRAGAEERGREIGENSNRVTGAGLRAGRVRVNAFGPIELRNRFLNLDKGFSIL